MPVVSLRNDLQLFPIIFVNTGLPKDAREKVFADFPLMRIRESQPGFVVHHVLMSAAGVRPRKAERLQITNQVRALDGPNAGIKPLPLSPLAPARR